MGKQRRGRETDSERAGAVSAEQEPGQAEQQERGNQAALEGILASGKGAESRAVEAVATSLVERALLSLQVQGPSKSERARYVQIVQNSRLPEARKHVLVGRLERAGAMAGEISSAFATSFGEDTPLLREVVGGALHRTWVGLDEGSLGESGDWRVGDLVVNAATPMVLLGELFSATLGGGLEGMRSTPAAAVQGFCQSVYLLLQLEEEEDDGSWEPSPMLDG